MRNDIEPGLGNFGFVEKDLGQVYHVSTRVKVSVKQKHVTLFHSAPPVLKCASRLLGFVFAPMTSHRILAVLLLSILNASACVTQSERVGYYPYTRHEDESVWEELRREFGWQKTPQTMSSKPFYSRATQGVKETVSGWFRTEKNEEENPLPNAQKLEESRRQFEHGRQEAFRRLRERQELKLEE